MRRTHEIQCLCSSSVSPAAHRLCGRTDYVPRVLLRPPRPTGNGASPTFDGRIRLQIYVDEAGMSSSQQDLAWNAVDGAAEMWNTATADGGTTDYVIEPNLLNQHQATFVVRIGQPGGAGCAEIDTTVMPHVITVSSTLLNAPIADRRAIIAHEIGHRLGLAEARQGGTCGSSNTIMAAK